MRILYTLLLFIATVGAYAQPSQVKKAAKSMFKLTTFDATGAIVSTGYGAFVSEDGICLATWQPFVGAHSANVIDAQGRKYEVASIIGANEIYNLTKFRVKVPSEKKMLITPMPLAQNRLADGEECWLAQYAAKAPELKRYVPTKTETFVENLPYYIFEETASDEYAGSPFINNQGELMGLMEPAKRRTDIYCPSALYPMAMESAGFTANEPTLRQTAIRIALPDNQQQAILAMLMMSGKITQPTYLATAEEFITKFPNAIDGYSAKASYQVTKGDFDAADATMSDAINACESKDEAHFNYAKLMYSQAIYANDSTPSHWSFEQCIDQCDKAYAVNPQPVYKVQKGKALFAQKRYGEAHDEFIAVCSTNMRSAENFYYASLCKQYDNAPDSIVGALLDSAVACYDKPYKGDAATYLLIRAKWLDSKGMSRKAVFDLNEYETIMQNNLTADFYYLREQMELRGKMYQLALNDINKACEMDTAEPAYLAEKALLQVRINQLTESIETSQLCMTRFPDYGDAFAINGLALYLSGKKKEGRAMFNKSIELKSELGTAFAEQYQ